MIKTARGAPAGRRRGASVGNINHSRRSQSSSRTTRGGPVQSEIDGFTITLSIGQFRSRTTRLNIAQDRLRRRFRTNLLRFQSPDRGRFRPGRAHRGPRTTFILRPEAKTARSTPLPTTSTPPGRASASITQHPTGIDVSDPPADQRSPSGRADGGHFEQRRPRSRWSRIPRAKIVAFTYGITWLHGRVRRCGFDQHRHGAMFSPPAPGVCPHPNMEPAPVSDASGRGDLVDSPATTDRNRVALGLGRGTTPANDRVDGPGCRSPQAPLATMAG